MWCCPPPCSSSMTTSTAAAATSTSCSGPSWSSRPKARARTMTSIEALGERLGVSDREGFGMTPREHIDTCLESAGLGDFESFKADKWADVQADFDDAHFLNGFGHRDGKFRFKPDWTRTPAANKPPRRMGPQGPVDQLPEFPDHVELIESADTEHPFRLATSPSRSFLNSSFCRNAILQIQGEAAGTDASSRGCSRLWHRRTATGWCWAITAANWPCKQGSIRSAPRRGHP
jgi:anaerobic selenocysteine-containing dehydrogenase